MMKLPDKTDPAIRRLTQNGLDPSLRRLAIIAVLPFLACILIVLHDISVSFKLLRDLFVVFAIGLVIAGGLSYLFISRERGAEEP